jgi:hypothetical protein
MPRNSYVAVTQDPRKMRFIEWLTTPPAMREPRTEEEFALTVDVHPKTLHNWKHDPEFKAVWHGETDRVVGGDDRRQAVMDALYEAASDPNHPRMAAAAKLWFDNLKAMSPENEPGQVVATKRLELLTDEEIEDLLARGLANQQVEFHDA